MENHKRQTFDLNWTVLNGTPTCLVVTNQAGVIEAINEPAAQLLDVSGQPLKGESFFSFLNPEYLNNGKFKEFFSSKDDNTYYGELDLCAGMHRSEAVKVDFHLSRIEIETTPYFVFTLEVPKKQAKPVKNEQTSEKFMRLFATPLPIGVFITDSRGAILYTNTKFQTILGVSLEESLFVRWETIIYPDDRDKVLAELKRAQESYSTFSDEFH